MAGYLQAKQEELNHLQLLGELINSELWNALKREIGIFYNNADNVLHAITNSNREYYAGKCRGYKDILELEETIDNQIKILENELKTLEKGNEI
ncbi:MAG: hypothetical protein FJ150_02760 [Euryarchaeota archaeon]|nr:hypothetical protein [Euryarchaeota archaeon]